MRKFTFPKAGIPYTKDGQSSGKRRIQGNPQQASLYKKDSAVSAW
jgi:hypothetical protein